MKRKIIRVLSSFLIVIIIYLIIINTKQYYQEKVYISKESCSVAKESLSITMKTKKGYKIYYTLDGSTPTKNSIRYKKKISLNKNSTPDNLVQAKNINLMVNNGIFKNKSIPKATILRAISIAPNGTTGPIETRTYFIGTDILNYYKDIAIISTVTDPKNLLDYHKGILIKGEIYDKWSKTKEGMNTIRKNELHNYIGNYTQKGKEWEREATIELFDSKKTSSWRENVGIRLKGNKSMHYSQKSFNIYFRKEYGNKSLDYELLKENKNKEEKAISKYKNISLRNGGNDTEFLKYKDQLIQDLVKDRKIDTQSGRPAIVFINGEYWGIYNLQEKYSKTYYSEHYNLNKNNIIVVKEGEIDEGTKEDLKFYDELMEYAKKDLSDEKTYNEFKDIVDIQSMLDYFAIEIYIGNADWGEANGKLKNTQLWRVREPEGTEYGDGKWRWSLYDTEYSSTLYGQEKTNVNYNTMKQAIDRQPLFKSAMNNEEFKSSFYETLKEIGKTNFNSNRVNELLDQYENKWKPYMNDYYKRFGDNSFQRENSIVATKFFFNKRYDIITNY